MSKLEFESRLIANEAQARAGQRPVGLPICQSTTFVMDDPLNQAIAGGDYRSQYLYTRQSNPTTDVLEQYLAGLHDAEDAVVFASGMAAISSTLIALVPPGGGVVADTRLYGAAMTFLARYLSSMGREVRFVEVDDDQALEGALKSLADPRVVYAETLTNPLVHITPLPKIAELAHRFGAKLVIDNSFANPAICQPLNHGADVVIESLSKSIAGHSDVHGGLAAGNKSLIQSVWMTMIHLGGCLDPHAAWLIWRGAKTLSMRTTQSQENAQKLVGILRDDPRVEQVWYPDEAVGAAPWLRGPGSMLSFQVRGGDPAGQELLDNLQLITPATSLGGVESLVSLPWNTSHRTPEARASVGLQPGTVRLSVGCEALDDLANDLTQALARLST